MKRHAQQGRQPAERAYFFRPYPQLMNLPIA